MADRKPRRRNRLDKERVVERALALVDAEGLGALSMRRLAAELRVEPMSIYGHIENKEALMTDILDLAAAEFELPEDSSDDWKTWVQEWMRSARRLFTKHPSLFPVLAAGVPMGPRILGRINAFFARLQAAGLEEETQLRIWEVLRAYLFGSLVQEAIRPANMPPRDFLACCPHLVRVMSALQCCGSERRFEEGMAIILSAVATPAAQRT